MVRLCHRHFLPTFQTHLLPIPQPKPKCYHLENLDIHHCRSRTHPCRREHPAMGTPLLRLILRRHPRNVLCPLRTPHQISLRAFASHNSIHLHLPDTAPFCHSRKKPNTLRLPMHPKPTAHRIGFHHLYNRQENISRSQFPR